MAEKTIKLTLFTVLAGIILLWIGIMLGPYISLGLMIAAIALFLIVWFVLAPRNLFFTFVPEGRAKIVVKGDKFEKVLIQWEGHILDKNWNVVKGEDRWHLFGGLRYYGFWPLKDLYIYDFEWANVKGNGTVEYHSKETLDYILLKEDVYYFKIEKAEDNELLPMELEIVITLRVINPYKALFAIQDWLETIINRTRPAVRDAVTKKRYDELIKSKEAIGKKIYKILEKRELLEEEFKARYGIEVRKIEIKEIDPGEEYRQATLKKYLAEREKERVITEAKAKREELEIVAEGERIRIDKIYSQIQKYGDLGKLIKSLEAMEKSPLAASMTVQAIPGLQEMLRGIFGKTPETVSSKDITALKTIIEELQKKKK